MHYDDYEKIFDNYVNNFDTTDIRVEEKRLHSKKVAQLSFELAKSLNLNDEDIYLATLIGYLHDIGRFPQLKDINSFSDKTYDHAQKGIEVLFNDGLIDKFNIDKNYYPIIKTAIYYHNKLFIPNEIEAKKQLFAKIIRDADKIDILRIISLQESHDFTHTPTEEILNDFLKQHSVNIKYRNNKTDALLIQLAFIYDLNYQYSYQKVDKEAYLDKIFDKTTVSSENEELFKKVKNLIKRKVDNNVR